MAAAAWRFTVPDALAGVRLDRAVADVAETLTRSQVRRLIDEGQVLVNGAVVKPSHLLASGDDVEVVEGTTVGSGAPAAEAIPLDIVYEDDAIVVVNKPTGLVVHPAPGNRAGTLVNALLHHTAGHLGGGTPERPGIVHRLDKDTSGLLVVAKTAAAHAAVARQFHEHSVDREYLALVWGTFAETHGTIEAPIGRAPTDRKRMTVTGIQSRRAITHFTVLDTFAGASELRLRLDTGRTHQVRVHCHYIGHSIIGDQTYGRAPARRQVAWPDAVWQAMRALPGHMLHATVLGLTHPTSGRRLRWEAPPPAAYREFRALLASLSG